MHTKNPIKPAPGYILCENFVEEKKVFKSVRDSEGEDQKSKVLAVGDSVKDGQGIERVSPCIEGDTILHAQTNKEFQHDHKKYRFVHFTEVHGVIDEE